MAYKKKAIKKTAKKIVRKKAARKAKQEPQYVGMMMTADGFKKVTAAEYEKIQADQSKQFAKAEADKLAELLKKHNTTDERVARFFEHIAPMLESVKDGGKVVIVCQRDGFTPHIETSVEVAGFRASPEFVGRAAFEMLDDAPLANRFFKEMAISDLLKA